jgi:serine/threonine protein kinase
MGAVYLAYDSHLERYVAIKTPFLGHNAQAVRRFYREAQAAAKLRSPFLCPIFDVGQISGVHYYSMAFIDGKPLTKLIAEGGLVESMAIANVVKKIARGLQKAHEQGIIHRDLKPDNVMIDTDGEPVVMDFGLARRIDEKIRMTNAGGLVGTPAYMSPEQVQGDDALIGPATDIYSLGVILFEILTGRLPFQGSLTSVLVQITKGIITPPSSFRPGLGSNSPIEQICLRMMARLPQDRFASMAEVAASLDQIAAPAAVASAPRPSLWSRLSSLWKKGAPADRGASTPTSSKDRKPAAAVPPAAPPGAAPAVAAAASGSAGGGTGSAPGGTSGSKPPRQPQPTGVATRQTPNAVLATTDLSAPAPAGRPRPESTLATMDMPALGEEPAHDPTLATVDLPGPAPTKG